MFKGMGDIMKIMKQAKHLGSRMEEVQAQLKARRVEGSVGAGAVTAIATGQGDLVEIKIADEVVDSGDKEMIEDLVTAAVNQALANAKEVQREELSKVTGGLDISSFLP